MSVFNGKIQLAFGGAAISGEGAGYGFGDISSEKSIDLLKCAYAHNIRIYDTAPFYGYHLSERRIGKAFKFMREKVTIISKSGITWHDSGRVNLTNDPVVTRKMLEESLRNINTDYIDLYMIHWPDKHVDIRRPMEVLAKAKAEGKIHHIGLCNTTTSDLTKAREIEQVEVVQSEFNVFNRAAEEELFPYLKDNEIEFMSYGTFDKGVLTDHATKERTYDKSDLRSWAPFWKKEDREWKYDLMEKIKKFAETSGHSLTELAIGHNLHYPEVSVTICGSRTPAQLNDLIDAYHNLPSAIDIKKLQEISK